MYDFWFWFYSGYSLFDFWAETPKHNTNCRLEWRLCDFLHFGIGFTTYHTINVYAFGFDLQIHHLRKNKG